MSIKKGTTEINKMYLGTTEINREFLGETLVYGEGQLPLPDFTGYNLTRFYATFKSNIALLNNMAEMTRGSSIAGVATIPFSGVDPDYGAISAIDDTVDWYLHKIYCQITGHAVNGQFAQPPSGQWCVGWNGATQTAPEKNGKPSFKFKQGSTTTTEGMKGTTLPELNSGNSFSIVSVVSNETPNYVTGVVHTSLTANEFLSQINDNRVNALNSRVRVGGVTYDANNLATNDTPNTKILITTVNGTTKEMRSYLGGVFQNTVTFSGTYTNDILRFGAVQSNNWQLDGHLQTVGIADVEWNAADCLGITNELKLQFGL